MAFLRIIFIIVMVYYLIRFLDRHVVPYLFGKPEKKSKTSQNARGREFRKKTSRGDVTITDFGGKKKSVNASDDDYVEYEEME